MTPTEKQRRELRRQRAYADGDLRLRADILLQIFNAATDLCEEIRATGTHESWKPLAHALDALEEANE